MGLVKEILVDTLKIGPAAFVNAYNSIAEEGMDIHFISDEPYPETLFLTVLNAAVKQDYDAVRENLETIRMSDQPMDVETDGYLLYKAGYAMLYQDQLALAEETFQLLVDTSPTLASLYIGLGDVYVEEGNIPLAIEHYEKAVTLEPRQQWLKVIIKELASE